MSSAISKKTACPSDHPIASLLHARPRSTYHEGMDPTDPETTREPVSETGTAFAQAFGKVEEALDGMEETTTGGMEPCWAATRQEGDTVVRIGPSRYPLPKQVDGWNIPASMREYALAILWRVMRSNQTKHLVKIRAIEALVRLDAQGLASERADDWREVQAGKATRSNVRALADMVKRTREAKSGKS